MLGRVENYGFIDFAKATLLQETRVSERVSGQIPDTLILLEHPLVVTLGRGARPENLLRTEDLEVVQASRGGDVTLHAPGQIVGYVIRLLQEAERDLHRHLRLLEQIIIDALREFGLESGRNPGKTGVWVGDRKIASLGVACRNWCTYHGFALNVSTDLSLFEAINPCGQDAAIMTSLERELGTGVEAGRVRAALAAAFSDALDRKDANPSQP